MNDQTHALRDAFLKCGWSPERSPAIASKTFATACTPKLAFLYQYPDGTLRGIYESEGRNALAIHFWRVDEADLALLHERVAHIDKTICDAVDATYARGLWLLGVRPRHVAAETASAI